MGFERRFLYNDSDVPYSDPDWDREYKKLSFPTNVEIKYPTKTLNDTKFIHASKRETMAILLDIRTCPLAHNFVNIQDAYEALGE